MFDIVTTDSSTTPLKHLAAAVDEIKGEDLGRVFDDQAETGVVLMRRLITELEAEWLRRVGDIEERAMFENQGYTSLAAWLAERCRLSFGRAKHTVGVARALADMPHTRAAFSNGDVDVQLVRQLVKVRSGREDIFAGHEEGLIEAVTRVTPDEVKTLLAYWQQAADYEAAVADAEVLYERRRLHLSETIGGMWRLDADLDPEAGQIIATALRAITEPDARNGDQRSSQQRRADALTDICRDFLDHGDTPVVGGENPHVTVIVDLDKLTGGHGRSEYDNGTVLTREDTLRLLCDSGISRIVTAGPAEVLEVGRRTRTVTAAQRRALVIRDGGCSWEGCDRPPRWCDAHHRHHWANGGETNLDNLTLLCRRHHRLAHQAERSPPAVQ